ncbi:MAG TPA: hypothetical protein VH518_06200, partial [Tepidisphaeraceae bacterium]
MAHQHKQTANYRPHQRNVRQQGNGPFSPSRLLEALETRTLLSSYYVSPSGSDAAAGTSASAPFKTLQKAANAAV